MSMDAFVTKTGLRVVNTWHSSTALKGRVELRRGKILSADIDFPQQKMEILDVSTEFFSIHGDQQKKQDLVTGNRKRLELCTGARLATITGLELCNEFQWPSTSMVDDAPYFPFTGPFSQSLVLHKRDTHAGYKFFAKRTGSKQNTFVHFNLNTPGSRTDRTIDVSVSLKRKTKEFEMEALTPWKKATLKGSMTSAKTNIGLKGQLTVDKSSEYIVISEVGIKRKKSTVTYTPRLEIRRPRGKVIQLAGTVETEVNKKASVELTLKGVTTHPVNLKSYLVNSKTEKSLKGSLSLAPEQDYVLEAGYVYQETGKKKPTIKAIPTLMVKTPKRELVSLKGAWEYKENKSLQGSTTVDVHNILSKPITFQCDMRQTSGKKTKRSAKVILRSEFLDAKVIGNVESTKKTVNPTVTLEYTLPKSYRSWSNKHTIRSKLTDHDTKNPLEVQVPNGLYKPGAPASERISER
ncbi:apolipophorins-like [Haliotis rubra]|uniref:apolipophorins-like n=1 Tax=Haliotis rubra TaxID=36100 RepID=UPI001EE55E44|nr:apolipophorins-like [Haliotis rubra]